MEFLKNDWLYLLYFWLLLFSAIALAAFNKYSNRPRPNASARLSVKRGDYSMGLVHGLFITVAGFNIAIGQVVFPFIASHISKYSFIMILLQTFAWAHIIYKNVWVRNRFFAIVAKAADEN